MVFVAVLFAGLVFALPVLAAKAAPLGVKLMLLPVVGAIAFAAACRFGGAEADPWHDADDD